jgi:hypothetical protein
MRFARDIWSALCLCALSFVMVPSAHASPILLPLDGTWTVIDDLNLPGVMHSGDFFTATGTSGSPTLAGAQTWSWTSNAPVKLDITDYFVATDRYDVFDNGVQVGSFHGGTEWQLIPGCDGNPFDNSCHWADTPDIGWGDPFFAHGTIYFAPGAHDISIRDVEIPFQASGNPFADGTVAFRGSEVPEPTSLLLLGSGLAGVAHFARKRRRS